MVKVQFIVGTHLNETFSIIVARHVARELTKQGVQVVITKHPLRGTQIGSILQKGRLLHKQGEKEYIIERKIIRKMMEKEKADYVINFHVTPIQDYWHSKQAYFDGNQELYDFELLHNKELNNSGQRAELKYNPNEFLVEIRAQTRPFPRKVDERIQALIKQHPDQAWQLKVGYLSGGTSLEETATKLGLDPRIIGKEIAKAIKENVITNRDFTEIKRRVKRISITRAQWEAKNKRRAHLLQIIRKNKRRAHLLKIIREDTRNKVTAQMKTKH